MGSFCTGKTDLRGVIGGFRLRIGDLSGEIGNPSVKTATLHVQDLRCNITTPSPRVQDKHSSIAMKLLHAQVSCFDIATQVPHTQDFRLSIATPILRVQDKHCNAATSSLHVQNRCFNARTAILAVKTASFPAWLRQCGGMVYTGAAYSTGELRVPSPGEGLLRFWTCRFGSAPQLSFSSGAAFRDTNAREAWTLFEAALPAGGAELVWRAEQGGTFSLNSYLAIDHVEFIPYADVSLAEALDTPGRMRAKMRVSRASSTGWVNMHIVPAL